MPPVVEQLTVMLDAGRRVNCRHATLADLVALSGVGVHVFLATYARDGVRPDLAQEALSSFSERTLRLRIDDPGYECVVADEGEGLLGFVEIQTEPRPAPVGNVVGIELTRLYVIPSAQGQGVGRLLLQAAHLLAAGRAARAMWLTAWSGNERALRFYGRMGYGDAGATEYEIAGTTYENRVLVCNLH